MRFGAHVRVEVEVELACDLNPAALAAELWFFAYDRILACQDNYSRG